MNVVIFTRSLHLPITFESNKLCTNLLFVHIWTNLTQQLWYLEDSYNYFYINIGRSDVVFCHSRCVVVWKFFFFLSGSRCHGINKSAVRRKRTHDLNQLCPFQNSTSNHILYSYRVPLVSKSGASGGQPRVAPSGCDWLLLAVFGFCQIYMCVIYRIPIFLEYFFKVNSTVSWTYNDWNHV